ncbi:MAG: hypothetical protein JXB04_09190, partial [Kiritimatiellae bacterium]|nr:hypothetical protein [Kiritimatiellia bacterium]
WNSEANFGGTTYRERLIRERYRVTDVYDVGYDLATTVAFPPPWEGDFGGPNPLIDNMPSDRKRKVTARTTWEAENRVDVDVESDLYELWFGPRLAMLLWKKISAYFIPSISATRVEMDAKRTEEFVAVYSDGRTQTLSRWEDDECEGEWLFGAGVQAGAEVDLGSGWFAGIFGGYDWVDEVEMDIGPNTVTLDPSGYTVGIEIGKKI